MWAVIIPVGYIGFVALIAFMSYRLGLSKTENPRATCVIGGLLALLPPLGLIYLAVLAIKEDVGTV